jgi:hypothetical protein
MSVTTRGWGSGTVTTVGWGGGFGKIRRALKSFRLFLFRTVRKILER